MRTIFNIIVWAKTEDIYTKSKCGKFLITNISEPLRRLYEIVSTEESYNNIPALALTMKEAKEIAQNWEECDWYYKAGKYKTT